MSHLLTAPAGGHAGRGIGPSQGLSVREVLDTLFRNKYAVLLLWLPFVAGAIAYAVLTPKTYEGSMTMLFKGSRAELLVSPDASSQAGRTDSDPLETQLSTEMELFSGRELLREVALEAGLAQADSELSVEKAVQSLKRSLKVAPVFKSNILEIKFTDTQPQRCARVLTILAKKYLARHLRFHAVPGSVEMFSQEAAESESKLREAHKRLTDFQSKAHIVLLPEQKDLNLKRLFEISAALREAEAGEAETANRIAELRRQLSSAGPRITTQVRTVPNQYLVEHLTTLIAELQNKRTEMSSKFRPEDRMVKQVERQIADTQRALENATRITEREEATDVNPLRQSLEAELSRSKLALTGLTARAGSLAAQAAECRLELARLEVATPNDQDLLREVSIAEQNYLMYAKKREEARMAQEMDRRNINNVTLLDPPRVPTHPNRGVWPSALAFALFGAVVAAALGFAAGHRRNTVYTPWELEAFLEIPVLATIPLNPPKLPARGLIDVREQPELS